MCAQALFDSMQWPDVLLPSAELRGTEPSEWTTEERLKVLGEQLLSVWMGSYVALSAGCAALSPTCRTDSFLRNAAGRTIYYWPVLRHFLWRGKVNEQDDGDAEGPLRDAGLAASGVEGLGDAVKGLPKRRKGRGKTLSKEVDFTLSWAEVEAKLLPTVVASLDAGGVEGASRGRAHCYARALASNTPPGTSCSFETAHPIFCA